MKPIALACVSILVLGASLIWILRPQAALGGGTPAPGGTPFVRRHYATLLSLGRGSLNGSVAALGLIQMGYPVGAALIEGFTAGSLSGFFQLTTMNERFSAYLNRASSEIERMVRWAWFQAIFYGLVKAAGTLAGGGGGDQGAGHFAGLGALGAAYLATIAFGSAQYPWEAAIAAGRALKAEQGLGRDRIRFAADLQTMAVSVTCVGASILNSVGAPHSRLFLVVIGAVGAGHYGLVRFRRALWRRGQWSSEGIVALVKN
jgi:hypothetical protein